MSVITVSSSFGTGGSVVAARVAGELGWPVHNRAIPAEVAHRLNSPLEEALARDEKRSGGLGSIFARFAVALEPEARAGVPAELLLDDEHYARKNAEVIESLAGSNAVIVGRGAAFILAGREDALHVRLDGAIEGRVRHAMEAFGIPEEEARRRLEETDRARKLYVKHFFQSEWGNPRHFHVVLDAVVLSIDSCVRIVIAAASERFGG